MFDKFLKYVIFAGLVNGYITCEEMKDSDKSDIGKEVNNRFWYGFGSGWYNLPLRYIMYVVDLFKD